jgi:tRNA(Arg) A34 adenosine deaminase TadA
MKRIINAAIAAAKETDGIKRYKLGAVLFRKGRIINAKGNSRKTHPLALRFSNYPYLHAEAHCIVCAGLDSCRDCNLFVTRITSSGRLTMALPCESCRSLIKYVGIKSVYYTDWNGEVKCIT